MSVEPLSGAGTKRCCHASNGARRDASAPTYSDALAWCTELAKKWANKPVLIEMESFGIASTMEALGLSYRVLVLRVVTDALSNMEAQPDQQQLDLLKAGPKGSAAPTGDSFLHAA